MKVFDGDELGHSPIFPTDVEPEHIGVYEWVLENSEHTSGLILMGERWFRKWTGDIG